ncbi:hypothetical protein [Endozoicomonas sp. SCSIO W0465]|uniref:hypothetical protein n=1 Tax=Endozoicomonas sp. SCSIO W0465 TaxID=2918516 RepID=UPI0020758E43|nr:hypothetical protein [Endozoicomonas sp. SCSIO W0465]USE34132.1 hypothetical protein MJO57_18385 [Endozoicomonas sp. SCSIO W0465]
MILDHWVSVLTGKKNQRRQLPYEGKESFKWQRASENTEQRMGGKMPDIISVCDREADIYEYMHYKLDNRQRFVVRATQNRILVDGELLLFDSLAQTEVLGKYTIVVPQKGGRKKRKATLQVKRKKMTIQAPQRPGGRPEPVTMKALVGFQTATGLNIAEALYLQRLSAYCPVMLPNPCFS